MDNMKALDNLCLSGDDALASGAAEKDQSVQCVTLLHMIGEESLDIYNTFTFSQDEVNKIQPLIQKFDPYFAPKKNITYQRHLFHTGTKNGRSFDNFLIDIKNEAKICEFGNQG